MLCKTWVQAWRDRRSLHNRGSSTLPWTAQDSYQSNSGRIAPNDLALSLAYPVKFVLVATYTERQRQHLHLKQQCCLPVPTAVQGSEQTALQVMKLLAWYLCTEKNTKVTQNKKPYSRVAYNTYTLAHHEHNSPNCIKKLWEFTLRRLSNVHY